MRSLKLKDLDELTLLTEKLETIVYLQELVKADQILLNDADKCKTSIIAEDYLLDLNKQLVQSLCTLINKI